MYSVRHTSFLDSHSVSYPKWFLHVLRVVIRHTTKDIESIKLSISVNHCIMLWMLALEKWYGGTPLRKISSAHKDTIRDQSLPWNRRSNRLYIGRLFSLKNGRRLTGIHFTLTHAISRSSCLIVSAVQIFKCSEKDHRLSGWNTSKHIVNSYQRVRLFLR